VVWQNGCCRVAVLPDKVKGMVEEVRRTEKLNKSRLPGTKRRL
jgi:hypothetical protein